jgi:manganese oxidase
MKKILKPIPLVVALLFMVSFTASPVQTSSVLAAPNTIVYNLYATDAYIPLADGSAVYNYGFVGGRAGQPLTFTKSVTPGDIRALDTNLANSYTYNGNVTLPGGAPAPTGGPVTGDEALLAGNAQFPSPLIYAAVGDVVEVRLKNLGVTADPSAPNDPHSIHLHGLDVDAANDGVPETSLGAIPANAVLDNGAALPGAGNVVVYMFSAKFPGTTMYHCHQEASIHVQMGMYGALVIYSADDRANANSAYNHGGPGNGFGGQVYGWKYDKDYVLLESEIAPPQHVSEELNGSYNPVDFHPSYWFLNGLSFPNTIHVGLPGATGWTDWIAAHPGYDPFITGSISTVHAKYSGISRGDKVLIRMINMGYETQPMHMHGFHGKVIGSDQRAWTWANIPLLTPTGLGLEKNTLTIGSGEAYEWLIDFGTVALSANYPTGTQSRYDLTTGLPVANGNTTSPAIIPNPDDGISYIGGPAVTGAMGIPTPGQLFPFHNHDDYKATNNGTYPGGMFTMIMPLP